MKCRRIYRRVACIAAVVAVAATALGAQASTSLRVMSYNILVGGARYGPLSQTVGVINTAQADVIGIQEVGGRRKRLPIRWASITTDSIAIWPSLAGIRSLKY